MTPEQDAALRKPFDSEQIGKLPKPTKRDNPRGKCSECGGYHGLPAVHLDYVGHAAITDRLRQVDREWTWKPLAVDERGLPLLDAKGGLWIELTIGEVTRPGYGDETNGKGTKEIIGDALRNAAMRFGVGLDLWSKEDLSASSNGHVSAGEPQADPSVSEAPNARPSPAESSQKTELPGATFEEMFEPVQKDEPVSASAAQKKKLDVVVSKLRAADRLHTEHLYLAVARMRDTDPDLWIEGAKNTADDGELHWGPLRDSLSKGEASSLIDRLTKLEAA
jgi:hypothetical protein